MFQKIIGVCGVYVRAVDEEKKKALNSLPKLDIL